MGAGALLGEEAIADRRPFGEIREELRSQVGALLQGLAQRGSW